MADTLKRFAHGTPPNSLTTVYTVPAGTTAVVRHIAVSNPQAGSNQIEIRLGGPSITAGVKSVDASSVWEWEGLFILEPGDVIEVSSDLSTPLRYSIAGLEVT